VYPAEAYSRSTPKPHLASRGSESTRSATTALIAGVTDMYAGERPRTNPMFCTDNAVFSCGACGSLALNRVRTACMAVNASGSSPTCTSRPAARSGANATWIRCSHCHGCTGISVYASGSTSSAAARSAHRPATASVIGGGGAGTAAPALAVLGQVHRPPSSEGNASHTGCSARPPSGANIAYSVAPQPMRPLVATKPGCPSLMAASTAV